MPGPRVKVTLGASAETLFKLRIAAYHWGVKMRRPVTLATLASDSIATGIESCR